MNVIVNLIIMVNFVSLVSIYNKKEKCKDDCNSNGKCDRKIGKCSCYKPFSGEGCEIENCINNCSGHGICLDKNLDSFSTNRNLNNTSTLSNSTNQNIFDANQYYCRCENNYFGEHCERTTCKCTENGKCDELKGICVCKEGFGGVNCELSICKEDCNFNGNCKNGKCYCYKGYTGETCSNGIGIAKRKISIQENKSLCLNNCNNNGLCLKGKCLCLNGFYGINCENKL